MLTRSGLRRLTPPARPGQCEDDDELPRPGSPGGMRSRWSTPLRPDEAAWPGPRPDHAGAHRHHVRLGSTGSRAARSQAHPSVSAVSLRRSSMMRCTVPFIRRASCRGPGAAPERQGGRRAGLHQLAGRPTASSVIAHHKIDGEQLFFLNAQPEPAAKALWSGQRKRAEPAIRSAQIRMRAAAAMRVPKSAAANRQRQARAEQASRSPRPCAGRRGRPPWRSSTASRSIRPHRRAPARRSRSSSWRFPPWRSPATAAPHRRRDEPRLDEVGQQAPQLRLRGLERPVEQFGARPAAGLPVARAASPLHRCCSSPRHRALRLKGRPR